MTLITLPKRFTLFVFPILITVTAFAQNYSPNTLTDPTITTLNNATGAINGGATISLRSALKAADNLGGTHIITLGNGTYVLDGGTPRTIWLGNTAQTITINGNGPANTIISMAATGRDRIMTINYNGSTPNVFTTINGVKFQNGYLTSDEYGGAAIYAGPIGGNIETLTINNCTFDNNICPSSAGNGGVGGAIYMFQATLNIDNSTFTNNKSIDGDAGAVFYTLYNNQGNNGAVSISNSTFTGNTCKGNGGAILVTSQGAQPGGITFTVAVNNNTFTNNTATGYGGGLALNNGANLSVLQAHYNRFVGNVATASALSSGLHFVESSGSVDATNNWWGCNGNPVNGASTAPCNQAGGDVAGLGSLSTNPWLQLKTTSASNPICNTTAGLGNTNLITTGFLSNSAGTAISAANLARMIGLPVTWGPTVLGSLSGSQGTIQASGNATALFTSNGSGGAASVNTEVDNVPTNDAVAKASFTVNVIPVVTLDPVNKTHICTGTSVSYTATASGTPVPSVQWQVSTDGGVNFSDIGGQTNGTYTFSTAAADNNKKYRAIFTNTCGKDTTAPASLNLNAKPVATPTGSITAFVEGNNVASTPVFVDNLITVSDIDDATLASATVSITANLQPAEDILAFINNNAATYGNISASYNAATGILTLTSSGATATLAQWQSALRAVTYTNSSDLPNTLNRTIGIIINDGCNNSIAVTKTVSVTSVNDWPITITSGGTITYVSPTAATVDASITVSDLDNTTLASGTVSIGSGFLAAEDVLSFTNNNAATYGNIAALYNSGTGILTLISAPATATIAQWQSTLRAVKYSNSALAPNKTNRVINFVVNDGTDNSTSASKTITITRTSVSSDYFRSLASGNWNSIASWESSPDNTTWYNASLTPDFNGNIITIRTGHNIDVTVAVTADQLVLETGCLLRVITGVNFIVK